MKFICVVTDERGENCEETYDKPTISSIEAARSYSEQTINNFNSSLRPGELPRRLVDVRTADQKDKGHSPHSWEKTNLVTQVVNGGPSFDTARCSVCKITARRYGLGGYTRDQQYKAKGFESCSRSIELIKRRDSKLKKEYHQRAGIVG